MKVEVPSPPKYLVFFKIPCVPTQPTKKNGLSLEVTLKRATYSSPSEKHSMLKSFLATLNVWLCALFSLVVK